MDLAAAKECMRFAKIAKQQEKEALQLIDIQDHDESQEFESENENTDDDDRDCGSPGIAKPAAEAEVCVCMFCQCTVPTTWDRFSFHGHGLSAYQWNIVISQ